MQEIYNNYLDVIANGEEAEAESEIERLFRFTHKYITGMNVQLFISFPRTERRKKGRIYRLFGHEKDLVVFSKHGALLTAQELKKITLLPIGRTPECKIYASFFRAKFNHDKKIIAQNYLKFPMKSNSNGHAYNIYVDIIKTEKNLPSELNSGYNFGLGATLPFF